MRALYEKACAAYETARNRRWIENAAIAVMWAGALGVWL